MQVLRVAAPSLKSSLSFVGDDATGYFQLTYGDAITGPISAHASALDLRDALEAMTIVHTVSVSRSYSAEIMIGNVIAVPGSETLLCADVCNFSGLPPGELIRVGGLWYKVRQSFDRSSTTLPLARVDDSSIISYYTGVEDLSAPLYRWARGYEWTITFLSVDGDKVLPLGSTRHGLNPMDASVSIRLADCVDCAYIDGLTAFTTYSLRVRAHNANGYGPYGTALGTPRQIPNAPNAVSVTTLSDTQLEVFFSPPSGVTSDITQYTIEWDTDISFSHVISGSPSCSSSGYGQCELQGSFLNVVPPYRYIVNYLTINTRYYIRVAARNSISFMVMESSGNVDEGTTWSGVVSTVTANQVPTAPVLVTSAVSGPNSLQILITPPTSDGGLSILNYLIEWDGSENFDDMSTFGQVNMSSANLPMLQQSTRVLVYEIVGLTSGTTYWVRVAAQNSKGVGPYAITVDNLAPVGKPSAPTGVALTTAISQITPVTSTDVTWSPPLNTGGSPISNYLVEWWEGDAVPEVQVIQFTSTSFPFITSGQFTLSFGPQPGVKASTTVLDTSTNAFNLRSELINLGYTVGLANDYSFNYVIGDVNVTKSNLPKGYQWMVTFLSSTNYGNQVSLVANSLSSPGDGETVQVFEITSGSRPGGFAEIQILSILSSGSTNPGDLGGWFRLSFNGTETQTPYLKVSASEAQMKQALLQLNTSRSVDVTRTEVQTVTSGVNYAGYEWTIVFTQNIGNQPALSVDARLIYTNRSRVLVSVYDGNNSLSEGFKVGYSYPGETPKNYHSKTVDKDTLAYTIGDLVPGNKYSVAVSAVNSVGTGVVAKPSPVFTSPVKQVPQPPQNVALNVHTGSATTLDIAFESPKSDGGAPILNYRVELDVTTGFQNPIVTTIPCPTSNVRSVFEIQTAGHLNDPIVSGYFSLTFKRGHVTFLTDFVPYDATSMLSDETGVSVAVSGVDATVTHNNAVVVANVPADELIFKGDRVWFDNQLFPQQTFIVTSVVGTAVTLDSPMMLSTSMQGSSQASVIHRVIGGRGQTSDSRIACVADSTLCPVGRRELSGSIQSKFQSIPEAVFNGVTVDRVGPDTTNGVIWRVTFLDDSQPGSLNFALSVTPGSNTLTTSSGATAVVNVTELVKGVSYSACTGSFEIPGSKALSVGHIYYARVFAINEVGYSLPQAALTGQKPQVVPGPPTAVVLSVASETELRVRFNQPIDGGGDTVSSYLVEYSPNSNFFQAQTTVVRSVSGGAPFTKVITGLTTGTFYFVRVRAGNSLGYGDSTSSVPPSLNPCRISGAPQGVQLLVTSDSMLTVSFSNPLDDGGDVVTKYRVEWDISSAFNSQASAPHKGYAELDAAKQRSFTITSLTKGQNYFARVFAINTKGLGTPMIAPFAASPALQVPGRPQTIAAISGLASGNIIVSWLAPRVPWHNVPCAGLVTSVEDCPLAVAGGAPASNGGSAVLEYEISYNDLIDFSGRDSGLFTVPASNLVYTLRNLTPDRMYYIRVLARNAQGAGSYCRYTDPNCLAATTRVTAVAKA
jgi:hypothetical protein